MIAKLRKNWLLLLCLLMALLCGECLLGLRGVKNTLRSQQAAERWRGDNSLAFAQVTCCMPSGSGLSMEQLYAFKNEMAKKLIAASFDLEKTTGLYADAWSSFGTVRVSAGRRSGEVQANAVGGRFFDFHPLHLVSGNYLSPDDVMDDRVLLDRETAWLLFGGTELSGMSFSINGVPFVVAGVYDHDGDRFTRRAVDEGVMSIYMSWEGYRRLISQGQEKLQEPPVSCYELVMAEPVTGFAYSAAKEKFPVKTADVIDNSHRYETGRLLRLLRDLGERSMRKSDAAYPYWENAARSSEDSAALLLGTALLLGAFPAVVLIWQVIRLLVFGKRELEEDLIPKARDNIEEAVRVRARRRWEKKHPDRR